MSRALIIVLLVLFGLLLLSLYKIHVLEAKIEWLKDDLMFLHKIVRFQGMALHKHLKNSFEKPNDTKF